MTSSTQATPPRLIPSAQYDDAHAKARATLGPLDHSLGVSVNVKVDSAGNVIAARPRGRLLPFLPAMTVSLEFQGTGRTEHYRATKNHAVRDLATKLAYQMKFEPRPNGEPVASTVFITFDK